MRSLAHILKVKGLDKELSNGSVLFRERLDKGCPVLSKSATPDEIQRDNDRRRTVLTNLLSIKVKTKKGKYVALKDQTLLQAGLLSILKSRDAMDALTRRRHPIRLEGNRSAHTVQSVIRLQEQLTKDKNHPLSASSKDAMKVFTEFFINVPEVVPPIISEEASPAPAASSASTPTFSPGPGK